MNQILEVLTETAGNAEIRMYTILTGQECGKKLLIQNQNVRVAESEFFRDYREELEKAPDIGCFEVEGVRLFAEKIGRCPKLVVCGGGHVAVAVVKMAVLLGIQVTVLEDRLQFADHARRAGAVQVICNSYERGLSQIEADADTYFVVMTRGHRYDQICVEQISHMPHAYLGMMGSKRRVAVVKKEALEHGASYEAIASLHAPIGLSIHAETPEEIAVSVMAEIIAEKGKKNATEGFSKEILRAWKDPENAQQKKVLATIVSRKGSAPRAVGTKMLILQDGRLAGTIGGGCMEAKVITRARQLMESDSRQVVLMEADLTADEAEDEGMVCGGVLEVFLEAL